MSETFVVVGGGLASATAVTELRSSGFTGRIIVYGAEHHLPYERPPLSKGYLLGNDQLEAAFVHPSEWYDEQEVDLRLGVEVTDLDPGAHTVTAGGRTQAYDRLLLATGASPRRLSMADASGAPAAYLRTIEDSNRIKDALQHGQRVAVVGGGWIGLEVAAAARSYGCDVVVLESLDLPLLRVLGLEVAQIFADLHRKHGVDLRTGITVSAVARDSERAVVHLGDGTVVEADLLVVGVGVAPNTALAEAAGLTCDNGVVVDEHLRASAADVFAAGDVANAYHPLLGRRVRVEHWDNAIGQGRMVAHSMLGREETYERMPYFFTDQYDLGMEYVGSVGPDGYDEMVLRGDVGKPAFTAFWLRGGQVLAGMQANDWDATEPIRGLVGRHVDVTRLRDEAVPLTGLVP
jgi:3-phenylpropionate/trans-cinnamate dioxygenase ferredoxin reductase subunit